MESTPDISKVISLIMEKPEIIESLRSMLSSEGEDSTASAPREPAPIPKKEVDEEPQKRSVSESIHTSAAIDDVGRKRRNMLLSSLKPYVSESRARAIDTMMSLGAVLDIIKGN